MVTSCVEVREISTMQHMLSPPKKQKYLMMGITTILNYVKLVKLVQCVVRVFQQKRSIR